MKEFDLQLLRLKECLGVMEDQEVATLLGLSKFAFSDRKKRGSFPKDKLLALKANRPDLLIDDIYILTGEHRSVYEAKRHVEKLVAAGAITIEEAKPPAYHPPLGKEKELLEKFNRLDESNKFAVEAMINALLTKNKMEI